MDIYVLKDNQQWGPYSKEDLASYLAEGNFTGADLAWSDGMAEWQPLNSFFKSSAAPPPAPRVAPPPAVVATPAINQNLLYESRKKSAGLACFLNFIIPGAGYCYAGRWILGIFIFGAWVICLCLFFLVVPVFFAIGIWLLGIFDGFLAVNRANRKLAEKILASR